MATADNLVVQINQGEPYSINLEKVNRSCLFQIEDTSYLYLKVDLSSRSSLVVEADQYKIENHIKNTERNILSLSSGKNYQLSGGELYYLPGKYLLIYRKNGLEKKFYFEVTQNRALSADGYSSIIASIEKLLHGLSFDYHRKGKNSFQTDSLFALKEKLEEEYRSFQSLLHSLLLHLNSDIKNEYVRFHSIGKADAKSIRMNASHPSFDGREIYQKKKVTYDTKENQNIKKMILQVKKKFLLLSLSFQQKRQAFLLEEEKTNISSFSKQKVKDKSEKEKEERNLFLEDLIDILKKYIALCNQFLSDIRVKEIKEVSSLSLYHEKENRLKRKFEDLFNTDKTTYQYKSAPQLFEYYGFYLIHQTLVGLGYQLMDDLDFISFRENETCINYENEKQIIAISYGPYCESYLEAKEKEKTISINSKHRSPDFIIGVYEKETGNLLFENVFEVKYIPYQRVMDSKEKTEDILETVSDYLQLGYLSNFQGLKLGVIHKVFVLFVSPKEIVEDYLSFHYIYFLGVNGKNCENVNDFLKDNILK